MTTIRVCSVGEVAAGEAKRFALDGLAIAVVNLGEEGMHALDAVCSHEHAWLDECIGGTRLEASCARAAPVGLERRVRLEGDVQ